MFSGVTSKTVCTMCQCEWVCQLSLAWVPCQVSGRACQGNKERSAHACIVCMPSLVSFSSRVLSCVLWSRTSKAIVHRDA
jgi:hypothetical protein